MRVASGTEAIGETQEFFLVDRVEHFHRCPLSNFVFEHGDANGAFSPVRFLDVYPLHRSRFVRTPLQARAEVFEILFQSYFSSILA